MIIIPQRRVSPRFDAPERKAKPGRASRSLSGALPRIGRMASSLQGKALGGNRIRATEVEYFKGAGYLRGTFSRVSVGTDKGDTEDNHERAVVNNTISDNNDNDNNNDNNNYDISIIIIITIIMIIIGSPNPRS